MHIQQHNVAIVHLITVFPENQVTKHLAACHRLNSSDYRALSLLHIQRHCDFQALQISQANIKAFSRVVPF